MRNPGTLLLVSAALSLLPGCPREDGRGATPPTSTSSPATATPAAPAPAAAQPASAPAKPAGDARELSLEEAEAALPGFPLGELAPFQRSELVRAAEDELCTCGCPHTIAGCLKEHTTCKHAVRAATLLAGEIAAGASRSEALLSLTRYYGSFAQAKRKTIDVSASPCKGPADAKITLVEFADYECPHCAAALPVLERIVEKHKDVRLCFKHYPLPSHSNAMSASQAGVFAHGKGRFWELHRKLFENQQRLSPDKIKALVAEVGLDPKELVAAVAADQLTPQVEKDKAHGRELGIMGTPAVFVNGRQLELGLSEPLLDFTLEEEREWQANGGAWGADQ